tara:strand:- start:5800 stop:6087 length:288 start_codon:yes stop_codon:yes gene_type:complete
LNIRNNINGDFIEIKELSDVKPGAFINLDWKGKNLMLPLSLKKGSISFSDLKWEWKYEYNKRNKINEEEANFYEILSKDKYIKHNCQFVPRNDIS